MRKDGRTAEPSKRSISTERSRARALVRALACGLILVALTVIQLSAQTAISADGVVESTSGGFRFPDGSLQTTAAGPFTAPVEASGLTACWDAAGDVVDCTGTGQDGDLQRGVPWPAPRFTDNGDGTVTDNLTGLIWLKLADCFGSRTWLQALADAAGLEPGFCGITDPSVPADWRLPNVKELLSLVSFGDSSPALPAGHPFVNVSGQYWSSTSEAGDLDDAWSMEWVGGSATPIAKISTRQVWPVRGGQ